MRAGSHSRFSRRSTALILAAVVSLTAASSVHAAKPTRTVVTPIPLFLPAGTVCPFAVSGEPDERARQAITEFSDGRVMVIGHATPTLTNVETGTQFVQYSRYQETSTYDPATNTLTGVIHGRFFAGLFAGDVGPLGPVGEGGALLAIVGQVEFSVDLTTDTLTTVSFVGTATDLCEVLSLD